MTDTTRPSSSSSGRDGTGVDNSTYSVASDASSPAADTVQTKPEVGVNKRKVASADGQPQTAQHSAGELWWGDIPRKYAKTSVLRKFLYTMLPNGVQQPAIKRLVRKGYKAKKAADGPTGDHGRKQYFGFAILTFVSQEQAQLFMKECNGVPLGEDNDFVVRLNPANVPTAKRMRRPIVLGADPSIHQQLNGLTRDALLKRWLAIEHVQNAESFESEAEVKASSSSEQLTKCKKKVLVKKVAAYYEGKARRQERHVEGTPIPKDLVDSLKLELDALQWPATKHRRICAKHYLVLKRQSQDEGSTTKDSNANAYESLHRLLVGLMNWADPHSAWTHIAVTKNFIGAPHIDKCDISHQ